MQLLRKDRRAVAGFFEEIPAAAVVITVLLLFLSAVVGGLKVYDDKRSATALALDTEAFLEELRGYRNLTYQDEPGLFDAAKVTGLTISNLTYDFHPPFHYRVIIRDISNYTLKYGVTLATSPLPTAMSSLKVGIVRDSTTVDLWVPMTFTVEEYHPATLTVIVWE